MLEGYSFIYRTQNNNTMKSINLTLPIIQTEFVKQFDGTIESILNFEQINLVLNPTFTGHFFYVSGTTDENTITTKQTDGLSARWGAQTLEQEDNAYLLAKEVKDFILSFNPKTLEELVNFNIERMRHFGKISNVRKRLGFIINGEIKLIKGMKSRAS